MLGIDLVKVDRIEKLYLKYGDAFLKKIFSDEEIEYLKGKNFRVESIAGMYATKEAVSKALNTGIGKTTFKDIEIFYKDNSPYAKVGDELFKVSISHDGGFAVSTAISNSVSSRTLFKGVLKKREKQTHKGSYGKVGIVAGSKGMCGSAYLSSNAALKTGSGLVYNVVPQNILDIMSIKLIEPIVKSFSNSVSMVEFLNGLDAVAIGPGIGLNETSANVFSKVLALDKVLVVDADGLTLLAENLHLLENRKPFTTVLTPHLGEFSRLTKKEISELEINKKELAIEFSRKYNCLTLLKGNNTIVTNGKEVYVNSTGNPGMATAGSGDVLTGIIVSLLGRKLNPYKAACVGSYVHGLAGDYARDEVGEEGMVAGDILNNIPKAVTQII
ncbi:NAD(P)H-hydrate dehydratase [Anaerosphaera multitolerans]|uniref:Multifunctional fusion protein n=1 Tax=Anaerosphaera multitolerans TaxID=2487351 RepID=A0A437S6F3_9FIRM|nr:NAD(P)H-hydrate dehydratase [Anaerosphaera multitolerans]RVU54577.1 NAD(P)H-hydrate dehydratase [Anaerosphaera multitolerans]